MGEAANPVWEYFANIYRAAVSTFEGMAVTLSYMSRKPTTVQWPDRMEDARPLEEQLPPRYRGILEVDMGLCNACLGCMRDCPISCIVIETEKNAETKQRYMTRFGIDVAKCMYCGLCTEDCPHKAIQHTREFAHSTPDMTDLVLEFVDQPVEIKKLAKDEHGQPLIKKPGDKVRELLAKKGLNRGPRRTPAPVATGFADAIPYAGQPDREDLKKKAEAFAESNRGKAKPKAKPAAPKTEDPKA